MDVSLLKNAVDTPFKWDVSYKSDTAEDFASRLIDQDRKVDTYEAPEKIEAAERNEIKDNDPVREKTPTDERDGNDQKASTSSDNTEQPILAVITTVQPPATQKSAILASDKNATIPEADGQKAAGDGIAAASGSLPSIKSSDSGAEMKAGLATSKTETANNKASLKTAPKQDTLTNSAALAGPLATATASLQSSSKPTPKVTTAVKSVDDSKSAPKQNNVNTAKAETSAVKIETTEAVKPQAPVAVLDKIRQDEIVNRSEKEILAAKISEMISDKKGKIYTVSTASKTTTSGSPSLVSGLNAIAAATPTPAVTVTPQAVADTAINMVTQNVAQADAPIIIPNGTLATSLLVPGTSNDPTLASSAGLTGGAITGIDSTAPSSASQASMIARGNTQIGSPAEQISSQLATAAKDGVDRLKIQLHPAELGRVDIKLELGQDGRILAIISADNQSSLDLLKQDSRQLEQALQDAGFETNSDSLNFSLSHGSGQDDTSQKNARSLSESLIENLDDIPAEALIATTKSLQDGNLDIQV